MMKYAKTYPLTVVLGLYLMSNSLSSMAHFISLPKVLQYLSHWVFCWDFNSVSLEIWSKPSSSGY